MNQQTIKKNPVYAVVAVGFMAALVFVSSNISIPIPTPIGNTRSISATSSACSPDCFWAASRRIGRGNRFVLL